MIRVRHNGAESGVDAARFSHLGDLIFSVLREDAGSARAVERVVVNGCEIPEQSLEKLELFPLDDVHEIELISRPLYEIALASLESSRDYCERLRVAFERIVDGLRAGRVEEANRLYCDAIDGLGLLVFAVTAAARQLGDRGLSLVGMDSAVIPSLEQLVEAQEVQDWVRVADTLEYELAPAIHEWRGRIEATEQAERTA